MISKGSIAKHPRAATALIACALVMCGSLWLATITVPCAGGASSRQEILFCLSNYIAKFAWLAYPIASAAASLTVGAAIFLWSNPYNCQKPLYIAFFAAIGGLLAYPVAGGMAVILLKTLDEYWRSSQTLWMLRRLVVDSFRVSWPYAIFGAALAGGLAALVVKVATNSANGTGMNTT